MGEKKIKEDEQHDYMSPKQLMKMLDCSWDTISRRIENAGLPYYDLGGNKKGFSRKAIDLWLKKRSVNT